MKGKPRGTQQHWLVILTTLLEERVLLGLVEPWHCFWFVVLTYGGCGPRADGLWAGSSFVTWPCSMRAHGLNPSPFPGVLEGAGAEMALPPTIGLSLAPRSVINKYLIVKGLFPKIFSQTIQCFRVDYVTESHLSRNYVLLGWSPSGLRDLDPARRRRRRRKKRRPRMFNRRALQTAFCLGPIE